MNYSYLMGIDNIDLLIMKKLIIQKILENSRNLFGKCKRICYYLITK